MTRTPFARGLEPSGITIKSYRYFCKDELGFFILDGDEERRKTKEDPVTIAV